jgi:hypothetical protein
MSRKDALSSSPGLKKPKSGSADLGVIKSQLNRKINCGYDDLLAAAFQWLIR